MGWFHTVLKFKLEIYKKSISKFMLSDDLGFIHFCRWNSCYEEFGEELYIEPKNQMEIHKIMVEKEWISPSWIKFIESINYFEENQHSDGYLFRCIRNYSWLDLWRLSHHGNDRHEKDFQIKPRQVHIQGYTPNDFIWASDLDIAWKNVRNLVPQKILLSIYNKNELELIKDTHGYGWKLRPGTNSFKDALLAIALIRFHEIM